MHDRLVAEPIRLTYEDFCALPEDGMRYEILDGDLYMSPSPVPQHQRVVLNLGALLSDHARRNRLGQVFIAPLDVILDEHNIVEPDVIFVSTGRSAIITEKNIRGAPDLLVEVLSPSTSKRDTADKRNIYARCGVDHYWIIDPAARTILELNRIETAYAVVSECKSAAFSPSLFPGWQVNLQDLWE
jgi:Uma2 family endonuclease